MAVSKRFFIVLWVLCFAWIHVCSQVALGMPVSLGEAETVARNWMARTQLPISRQEVGSVVADITAHEEEERNLFYPNNRFVKMKRTHPKLHDYCINKLGIGKVLSYMQIPYGSISDRIQKHNQKLCCNPKAKASQIPI